MPETMMPSQLPSFQFAQPRATQGVSFGSIMDLLQAPQPSMTNVALPPIMQLLGQQSQFLAPQIGAIRERGEELAATQQSEAMRRGLTGSDIEAAGMLGARQGAAREEAQLRGQVGMQQAASMAQMIFQALGMDIQANREAFMNLAQALGQELAAQEERQMFERMLQEGIAAQGRQRRWGQQGMLLKGGFDIGTSLLKGGLGGMGLPMG